jgi:hypothetical protein
MKKIIFTFALLLSAVIISNAQTNTVQTKDSVSTSSNQVEFYSSEEEFLKNNPTFSEDVKEIAITNEAYIHFIKINKIYRKRLMA